MQRSRQYFRAYSTGSDQAFWRNTITSHRRFGGAPTTQRAPAATGKHATRPALVRTKRACNGRSRSTPPRLSIEPSSATLGHRGVPATFVANVRGARNDPVCDRRGAVRSNPTAPAVSARQAAAFGDLPRPRTRRSQIDSESASRYRTRGCRHVGAQGVGPVLRFRSRL